MSIPILLSSTDYNVRQELFSQNEQGTYLDPFLSESARTWRRNLLTSSEIFSTNWTATEVSVTDNATTSPTGTSNASSITSNTNNNLHRIFRTISNAVLGASYTFSCYLKNGTSTENVYLLFGSGFGENHAIFNLTNGTIVSQSSVTATISDAGSGWYRCSITATNTLSSSSFSVQIGVRNPAVFVGAATTHFVWGAQLETGSLTAYQPITDFSTEFKAAFPTHTIYQDSQGYNPATAPGDLVGLVLDQRQGALSNLGAECWTAPTPTISNSGGTVGAYNTGTLTMSNSGATVTGFPRFFFSLTGMVVGRAYWVSGRLTGDISQMSSSSIRLAQSGTANYITYNPATGAFHGIATAAIAGIEFVTELNGAEAISIASLSIREAPGNHAYQSTSGARPTMGRVPFGGRRNLLTWSEQFDNAAWTKIASSITANADTAPDGTTTADLLTEDSTSNVHYTAQSFTTTVQTYTFSVYLKNPTSNGRRYALLYHNESIKGWTFDLLNGVVGAGGTTGVTAPAAYGMTAVGNGWYRCYITVTGTAASNNFRVYLVNNDGSGGATYLGDGTSRLLIWGAQLETGSSATTYQRVTSTHDVTEAGQPDCWYLDTSGSKWMLTNTIDFNTWTQDTRRNLLTETESFGASAWLKTTGVSVTENSVANPINQQITADLITVDSSSKTYAAYQAISHPTVSHTLSFYVKADAGIQYLQISNTSAAGFANFDIVNGVSGTNGGGSTTSQITSVGDGWYQISISGIAGTIIYFGAQSSNSATRHQASTASGTFYLFGAQLEVGALTTYQRVGTDEMTVIAGVRKLQSAAVGMIAELSANSSTTTGTFWVLDGDKSGAAATKLSWRSRGSNSSTCEGNLAVNTTAVITGLGKIASDISIQRINGAQTETNVADQGSGNFGNHALYIGSRGGASLYFGGPIFHLIIRGKTTEGSKLTGAERLTARKTGITL